MFLVHFHAAASVWHRHRNLFLIIHASCICQNALRKQECERVVSGQGGQTVYEWRLSPLNFEMDTINHAIQRNKSFSHSLLLFGTLGGHGGWVRGDGYQGSRSNPPTLHERQDLFGNLCQNILCQSSHAKDLVPWAVDVVSERNKLNENRILSSQTSAGIFGHTT